jgi:spore coat polysaccharide biosynthesis protein SpsF
MRVVAIVQARVGSSRLPAKVMLDLGGQTALERCLRRAVRIPKVDDVLVATTDRPEDELVVALCRRLGFSTFRGSAHDVLSRYLGAATASNAEVVVRLTSDCPLLDPTISGLVVAKLLSNPLDYVSNTLSRSLPRGLDTEVVTRDALERASAATNDMSEREHVTMHVYRNRDRFRCGEALPALSEALGRHRWTLDTLDDYRFLYEVFDRLGPRAADAAMQDVIELLRENPDVAAINAHVEQKSH